MLFQRVAYITPLSCTQVTPQLTGSGTLGPGLFVLPAIWPYNLYSGAGYFDTTSQGLIAMIATDPQSQWGNYNDGGFRIVTKPDGTMDTIPFMQAMAALTSYGSADEGSSLGVLQGVCRIRPVEMRCGLTIQFVSGCAAQVGITTRQVQLINVTSQNFFDDGHVLCEARVNGSYVLFDVANGLSWADKSGALLSLRDVIETGIENCVPVKLCQQKNSGRATYPGTTCWIAPLFMMEFGAFTSEWCDRIYQVPCVPGAGGGTAWGLPDALSGYSANVTGYPGTTGWTVMPWSSWVAANY